MYVRSQLLRVGKQETGIAACASPSNESRLPQRIGMSPASAGMTQTQARAHADAHGSICGMVFRPSVQVTPAEAVKRLGTGWHWWFSESIHIPTGSKIAFRFEAPVHLLVLYHEGSRKDGETSIDSLHLSRRRSFIHKLTFVPAGCAYQERHETSASTSVTFLYLDPAAFGAPDEGKAGLPPRLYFEDTVVWETAWKLKNTVESSHAHCMSYLEALSGVLAHELSRVNQDVVGRPALRRGGLASWQKRAVADYIEEHLGEQVCLIRLAELARLSLHHFCRAFKQSFGMPAHQYQVQRRMEVAKMLLADRTTTVTDIALILGYAQTSSFSNAFRKTTGWTPTVYRREFK
jgi:AraC family transcriptional regulator